jgi:23S rRNA pseudouridine1911/1915/1917 synthase
MSAPDRPAPEDDAADDAEDEAWAAVPDGSEEDGVSVTITLSEAAAGHRLDKALAREVPEAAGLSRSQIARLLEEGAVRHADGRAASLREKAEAGAVLSITVPPAVPLDVQAEDIALDIRFEDADLIVVNKPAGMVVHPAPGSPRGTLVNALLAHCGDRLSGIGGVRRPGIVHRIDKDTSGLLVVAKSDRAHQGLAAQFAAHTILRRYLAVVRGVPSAGDPRLRGLRGVTTEAGGILRVATGLDRHHTDRQRQAVVWEGGRHAVTRLAVEAEFAGQAALVACRLETGRTHQIRVHLAYLGHGLVGDPIYGGAHRLSAARLGTTASALASAFPRQALHAETLGFDHPVTGAALAFSAALPDDMAELVAALAAGTPD